MKYYIIAGERSGDLHGSYLVKELLKTDDKAEFRGWGGDMMQQAGMELVVHYKHLSFMGIWEVITNILTIKKYLDQCKHDLLQHRPDVLILIDYPGFNLKMAEFAHSNNIKVCYYISPKLWAWNQKRAHKIKRYVARMYTIFPFEKEFYQQFQYPVAYVGNPLVETINGFEQVGSFKARNQLDEKPVIAILPGSRKQEIRQMLRQMLALVDKFDQYNFVVAGVDNVPQGFYKQALKRKDVQVVFNQTYHLLSIADAALVASGTASLEAALFEVPQVVCYKTSWLTYWLVRMAIKVKYISLVNLIADRLIVPELIQQDFNQESIATHLGQILNPGDLLKRQQAGYRQVKIMLGNKKASQETARLISEYLKEA